MNETKYWPCKEITGKGSDPGEWFYEKNQLWVHVPESWKVCPDCGAQRPEQSDGLDEIFDKHWNKYKSGKEWQKGISKDLRMWKIYPSAGCQILDDPVKPEVLFKKEKPKKLWEILDEIDLKTRFGIETVSYNVLAKAAIEAVEKVIDSVSYDGFATYESVLETIKRKLKEKLL